MGVGLARSNCRFRPGVFNFLPAQIGYFNPALCGYFRPTRTTLRQFTTRKKNAQLIIDEYLVCSPEGIGIQRFIRNRGAPV